jgi:hypothetical protein
LTRDKNVLHRSAVLAQNQLPSKMIQRTERCALRIEKDDIRLEALPQKTNVLESERSSSPL